MPEITPAVASTCTETGLTEGSHCGVCGEVLVAQNEVAKKAHVPVIDAAVEATCTSTGLTQGMHCGTCDMVFLAQTVVDKLEHEYVDGTCACGAEEPVSGPVYNDTLKLLASSPSISFQKYIGVQAVAHNKNVVNKFDKVYVVAKQVATDGTVKFDGTIEGRAYNGGTTYTIFEVLVESWDMTDTITVTLYGEKDGVTYYGQSFTTSVETMALDKLASYKAAGNMAACRVLVDMLNYGAQVQSAFDHNAGSLPNTKLAELGYSELGTAEDPAFEATESTSGVETIPLYRMSFSMKSKVEIQMIYNTSKWDISRYEVRYTVKGVTYRIPYRNFAVMKSGNTTYRYAVISIDASDMREMITIGLYDPDTNVAMSKIYTCSVESKAATYYNSTSASYAAYKAVVTAMLKYGDAVNAIA